MPSQAVQPLRIQKSTPSSSPNKMNNSQSQRPLSELSPMERRRNSPSSNQATKKSMFSGDSSPFDPSPYNPSSGASPRLFWQGRDPSSPNRFSTENSRSGDRDGSLSPTRRTSIEHLKRASRVRNSKMFAREHQQDYDPTSIPAIERPLANGRPLSTQAHGNAYGGRGIDKSQSDIASPRVSLMSGQAASKIPIKSPAKSSTNTQDSASASASAFSTKIELSPTKSSLSKKSRYSAHVMTFDPENETWSDEDSIGERQLPPGRVLHRHAKSVTFDVKPPQVNEYEMTTPDLSSVGTASRDGSYDSAAEDEYEGDNYDRAESVDRDDSFDASLEDTAKTPVVGPEDWRFMSPAVANEGLAGPVEDPFNGETDSPMTNGKSSSPTRTRPEPSRTDSDNSNGDHRPLPPLPGVSPRHATSPMRHRLAERVSSAQRALPSPPPPAPISKSDIQGMGGGGKMSLEDRLRLMMVQDGESTHSPEAREQETRQAPSHSREHSQNLDASAKELQVEENEVEKEQEDEAELYEDSYKMPPRISRESILRKVKAQSQIFDDLDFNFSSPLNSSPNRSAAIQDPDKPIPSTELENPLEDASVFIKEEGAEDGDFDVYSIPDMYGSERPESRLEDYPGEDRNVACEPQREEDEESHYSRDSFGQEVPTQGSGSTSDENGPVTPRPTSPAQLAQFPEHSGKERMSLPEFASLLGEDDFNLGLRSYMTPSPGLEPKGQLMEPVSVTVPAQDLPERPVTPETQLQAAWSPSREEYGGEEPQTPDSVIRHPVSSEASMSPPSKISEAPLSPAVPEPVATIKAPGGRLKTRPSATPSDLAAMSAARRQISGERPSEQPAVPAIPARHRNRPSLGQDLDTSKMQEVHDDATSAEGDDTEDFSGSGLNRRKSLVKLSVPMTTDEEDLSFGLDKEFDRLIEGKKKGYLMRQNTKMIVASSNGDEAEPPVPSFQRPDSKGTRSAGNSPSKSGHSQTWSVEPWNGNIRRKSIKDGAGSPRKKRASGPAPPLPGQESNVAGLGIVTENETPVEEIEIDEERGRLFVKVVSVKDLDLPLPKNERTWFRLTLDNGVHCVTTAWLELGKNAPIGQEFELVVLEDLEFTLTLETKLEQPQHQPQSILESMSKPSSPQKKSTFSRVFASPKKRKELDRKQQEDDQRAARQKQQDAQAKRLSTQPTAWDLLHNLVAHGDKGVEDGTFARAYVSLKEHEGQAFGRPYSVDIACFNEWATEPNPTNNSLKTKQGGVQRRAPYRIGKLDVQLLYVPKPKGATDDDMPKSLNACVRQLKEAEANATRTWEGHLSQQGGDCPYWRRRFFKLNGSKLTAYHEATHQPRATINLTKACKLIDDRSALMQKGASGKNRRKSAFSEEEEGYMFVEEGFRIRFANGEVIDFYADSASEKDGWMKVLAETAGKDTGTSKAWTEIVLAREAKSNALRSKPTQTVGSAPSTPHGRQRTALSSQQQAARLPPPAEESPRHQQSRVNGGVPRSMLF
ncbi:MAG: Bud site selection protein bud4 [Sclerophora amabilis]|nr:MAG: Bud site selection protein bud4 [Sclerophora amabilis]